MKLQEARPGDIVRLDFGALLVKVFEPRGNGIWCRALDEDGNEGEPRVVPGSWPVTKQIREEG
jgi:hypothetical protein